MKSQKGNVLICATIFIAIALVIFTFSIIIFMSQVTNLMYNLKTDMYLMNRAAIIAVNRNMGNKDVFSYDEKSYKNVFEEMLKLNYKLDSNFRNINGIVEEIEVVDYKIYKKGSTDLFLNKKCSNDIIHTVLKVKIRPIILKEFLEEFFVFEVHEDVVMNGVKM